MRNREGWPHITFCGGRVSIVGHPLFLSWVQRTLFTLRPFSPDLSWLADIQTDYADRRVRDSMREL